MKRRDPPFDAFHRGELPPGSDSVEYYLRKGHTQADAEAAARNNATCAVWLNSLYQVLVQTAPVGPGWPPMVWLSIKRRDRRPVHDWRHLQRIKNALVGDEHEAVELYPAESRMVDEANQFHLWVLTDPAARFPFGHQQRLIGTPEEAAAVGAVQRPFED